MTDPAHVVDPAPCVDERAALETTAGRLRAEFAGVCDEQVIARCLHDSYDEVAAHSTVPHLLPLLAERLTRQRPTALAAG
jgi:hypothetical protein